MIPFSFCHREKRMNPLQGLIYPEYAADFKKIGSQFSK
mgnify:CR=1 FL=1